MHILLVDDHALFREAIRRVLQTGFPAARIAEADAIDGAVAALAAVPDTDLVVLDLSMRGIRGFEGLLCIRARFPRVPILVCSSYEETRIIREALALGAAGFVPKTSDAAVYRDAVAQVMAGAVFLPEALRARPEAMARPASPACARISTLSHAQMNVLILLKQGLSNKEIAAKLGIGMSMVKTHATEIMKKLGVRSRTQAVIFAAAVDFERVGLA